MNTTTISDGTRSIVVSELCLGTMYFGTTVDENTSQAILDRFVDAGGTFLDTANAYSSGWMEASGERARRCWVGGCAVAKPKTASWWPRRSGPTSGTLPGRMAPAAVRDCRRRP